MFSINEEAPPLRPLGLVWSRRGVRVDGDAILLQQPRSTFISFCGSSYLSLMESIHVPWIISAFMPLASRIRVHSSVLFFFFSAFFTRVLVQLSWGSSLQSLKILNFHPLSWFCPWSKLLFFWWIWSYVISRPRNAWFTHSISGV